MSPYNEILCTIGVCFRKEEREQELYLQNFHLISFKPQYFFITPPK